MLETSERITIDLCEKYIDENLFCLSKKPNINNLSKQYPGGIGIEVETLPVNLKHSKTPNNQNNETLSNKISDILINLQKDHPDWKYHFFDAHDTSGTPFKKVLKIEFSQGNNLTFEPGGQLEISTAPSICLNGAFNNLKKYQTILEKKLLAHDICLTQIGVNPWLTPEQIKLQITKPRYQSMTDYYNSIGPYGIRMMRQTSTIQINLDYGYNEQTLVKRYVGAQLLAPFANAIFSFSPIIDNKKTKYLGYRANIWSKTSPTHTGTPGIVENLANFDKRTIVKTYLEFALNAEVVFISGLNFKNPNPKISFKQWLLNDYESTYPTMNDFKTHLSLLFPEVRPRGFFELRSVDAQAAEFQEVVASFFVGLLYNNTTLDSLIDYLGQTAQRSDEFLKMARFGLQVEEVKVKAQKIMQMAINGYNGLPECFNNATDKKLLEYFNDYFVQKSRTPANELIDFMIQNNHGTINIDDYSKLRSMWQQKIKKGNVNVLS